MTIAFRRLLVCSFVLLGLAAPAPLLGAVAGYSWFVQNDPDLIVQYDFVGSTDAERREDKSPGTNYLVEKQVGNDASLGSTAYGVAGFDSTSTAVLPAYTNMHNARGFFTSQMINMPTPVSFEAILQPSGTQDGYMAGVFTSSGSDSYRTYFVAQTGLSRLSAIAGDSYANNQVDIVPSFTTDHWYYVAVTMSYDPGTDQTTMNTWHANLTAGTPLTPTGQNVPVDGSYLNNAFLGIGVLNANGNPVQAWKGTIDEVTLYSGLKDGDFFQANLDRILDPMFVPEPSALILLCFGAAGLLAWPVRRRKRAA